MKPDHDNRLEAGGDLSKPGECFLERRQRPEIVGHVDNPTLEAIRRLWWRSFDRVCGFFVLVQFWIFDRIFGPELQTPADIQREADREWLVRAFPITGETIETREHPAGQNRDSETGSPVDSSDRV